jgi:hypothetical protein
MARRSNVQMMMDRLLDQIATAVVKYMPAPQAVTGRAACAVPGCGKPHSGPRYRFFCREHKQSLGKREQDRILAERSAGAAHTVREGTRRRSPRKGIKLDMSCRVADCKSVSGGPRHGFMCETHQKLSKKAQREAREKWKAARAA